MEPRLRPGVGWGARAADTLSNKGQRPLGGGRSPAVQDPAKAEGTDSLLLQVILMVPSALPSSLRVQLPGCLLSILCSVFRHIIIPAEMSNLALLCVCVLEKNGCSFLAFRHHVLDPVCPHLDRCTACFWEGAHGVRGHSLHDHSQTWAFWLYPASGKWPPRPIFLAQVPLRQVGGSGIARSGTPGFRSPCYLGTALQAAVPPDRSLPPLQASVSPHCISDQNNGWKTSLTAVFTCMSLMPGEAERRFMFHDHMYTAPSVHLLSGYFLSISKTPLLPSVTHLCTFSLVFHCIEILI